MSETTNPIHAKSRGFTNDGKVSLEIVNDSYGTVDPADSTGLDTELDKDRDTGSHPAQDAPNGRRQRP